MKKIVGCLFLLMTMALPAQVKLPNLFSDHAVLQRDMKLHVWGWASAGEAVTVTLHDQHASTKTDAQGRWDVLLAPQAAGGPYVLSANDVQRKDIYLGDVWLASGQSNMKYTVNGHPPGSVPEHAAEIKAAANIPQVRLLRVPQLASEKPEKDQQQTWELCTSTTMQDFSLIAYLFGKQIHEEKNVVVGLIESDYGGTPIEAWMSKDIFDASPAFLPPAMTAYNLFATGNSTEPGEAPVSEATKEHAAESIAKRAKAPAHMQEMKLAIHKPTNLFNGMIAPIIGYTMKGAMWYQGEQDATPEQAPYYAQWLPAMITDWRAKWKQGDFPFIIIQISSIGRGEASRWGAVRDAERRTLSLPNTGLAVTIDVGDHVNVHPPNKEPVAKRVVLIARDLAYGEKIEDSGPLFQGVKPDGAAMQVTFTHAEGLKAKSGALVGFEIAGADGKFSAATATIVNSAVKVSSPAVAAPKFVRYAWAADSISANLTNGADLPASTFTSEP